MFHFGINLRVMFVLNIVFLSPLLYGHLIVNMKGERCTSVSILSYLLSSFHLSLLLNCRYGCLGLVYNKLF